MQSVEASIRSLWPIDSWIDSTVVVGVSGGPDSVALLHALLALCPRHGSLVVAHIDHGLRGEESDGDREFVRDLAERWNVTCDVVRLVPGGADPSTPSEESLRKARHRYLREIATARRAAWIATAHHADDVVETLLHRLLRGTGPRGLASIAPLRSIATDLNLVHPLLSTTRAEILGYIEEHRLEFRTDRTNASMQNMRSRIRHQLLPYLREFVGTPHLDQRLWLAAQQIRDEHAMVETTARAWLSTAQFNGDRDQVDFPATAFAETPWCVVREALVHLWHHLEWPLQGMTAQHWMRLRRFLQSDGLGTHPRRMQLPGTIDVTMRRSRVRFTRKAPQGQKLPEANRPLF